MITKVVILGQDVVSGLAARTDALTIERDGCARAGATGRGPPPSRQSADCRPRHCFVVGVASAGAQTGARVGALAGVLRLLLDTDTALQDTFYHTIW